MLVHQYLKLCCHLCQLAYLSSYITNSSISNGLLLFFLCSNKSHFTILQQNHRQNQSILINVVQMKIYVTVEMYQWLSDQCYLGSLHTMQFSVRLNFKIFFLSLSEVTFRRLTSPGLPRKRLKTIRKLVASQI